jgi:membrane glycosyltransferase
VVCETLFSIFVAPVMLWFHTRFVLRNLAGQTVTWNTQTRSGGNGPGWLDMLGEYWALALGGAIFGAGAWWIGSSYFVWLLPILIGLWAAIPIAWISGRVNSGKSLFVTPEETEPPRELTARFELQLREGDHFVHAILDPFYNAVHVVLQRERKAHSSAVSGYIAALAAKLFKQGPGALTPREKRILLSDGPTMARLHSLIWKTPTHQLNPGWVAALSSYRANPQRARPSVHGEEEKVLIGGTAL